MDPNTIKLRDLMVLHDVSIEVVAALLGRKKNTVKCWRSKSGAVIPDDALQLLQFKLAAKPEVTDE